MTVERRKKKHCFSFSKSKKRQHQPWSPPSFRNLSFAPETKLRGKGRERESGGQKRRVEGKKQGEEGEGERRKKGPGTWDPEMTKASKKTY